MSHKANDIFLENVVERFDSAVEDHDYQLALDIIHDTADQGWEVEARDLERQLREFPVEQFSRETIHSLWAKIERGAAELKRLMDEPPLIDLPYPRNPEGMKRVDDNTYLK